MIDDREFKNEHPKIEEIESFLELFTIQADELAEIAYKRNLSLEKEVFELRSGKKTSVFNEKEKLARLIDEIPRAYEPRFILFFNELARLENWSEEEKKAYHKPPIAAQTINEVIYARFPKEIINHIHSKNPYIKYCTRQYKNYLFLTDDGILLLERFIDEAFSVMKVSKTTYEFRKKHAELYGVGFQLELFEKILSELIID